MRKTQKRGNPFRGIPLIDPINELDRAIKKARSLSIPRIKKPRHVRYKILILNRIETIKSILVTRFSHLVESIPDMYSIHEFYRAIVNIYYSVDSFKKQLGRISGSVRVIEKLSTRYKQYIRSVKQTKYVPERETIKHIRTLWKQYLSRLVSFIHEVKDAFHRVNELIRILGKLPDYNPDLKTIVVCGPPNSGKSSLVAALSNAKVEIAEYPFTTKNLVFGHIKFETPSMEAIQIVDSPGLFDRPISERKKEELLALEAIRTIADCIIFLFDCSIEHTLNYREQINIYREVVSFFKGREIIVAINKIDVKDQPIMEKIIKFLKDEGIEPLYISAKYRIGLDELLERIQNIFIGEGK